MSGYGLARDNMRYDLFTVYLKELRRYEYIGNIQNPDTIHEACESGIVIFRRFDAARGEEFCGEFSLRIRGFMILFLRR